MRRVPILIALIMSVALRAEAEPRLYEICHGYKIESKSPTSFNANERKLICGDPKAVSWQDIPRFQAEYFIRTFLQERGYFFPVFRSERDYVIVEPGEKTHIDGIEVKGNPPEWFRVWKRRKIDGAPLTPTILSALEDWTKNQLKARGFACPKAATEADAVSGRVTLTVQPDERVRILSVDEEEVEKLRPGTLRRFDAFHVGDIYDNRNLTLTARRIGIDGILQSSYFLTECTPEGAKLTQKSIPGAKRLVSVGFGASTEEYFIIKGVWKQARIGKNGSSFQVAGRGSYRKQRLFITGHVYPLPFPTRWHLRPSLSTRRENEKKYEYLSTDIWLPPAVTWDTPGWGFELTFGPKFNFTRTFKGAQSGWTHFLSLATTLEMMSHDYEYYIADPRSGYTLRTYADLASGKIASTASAQRLGFNGQALWNIAGLEPPLLIFGIRGSAATTITEFNGPDYARLPPWMFHYLGGSANMRGFSRMGLPKTNRGSLTSIYAGAELRLANILPLNLQPIAFVDVGALGNRSFDLGYPAYWSPGLGIRWPSFIGVVRLTFARGYLINNNDPDNLRLSHWQFYFTLGEEF